jgi:hypothetical protein
MDKKVKLNNEIREFEESMKDAFGHIRELLEVTGKDIRDIPSDFEPKLVWHANFIFRVLRANTNRSALQILDDFLD